MSDKNRFEVVAKLTKRRLPNVKKVADIAGGSGKLAKNFIKLGIEARTFDLRKPKKAEPHYYRVDVASLSFTAGEVDCIVGLHPDGATWYVIRLAQQAQCPFVLVPCCEIPPTGKKPDKGWISWLVTQAEQMGFEVTASTIPIKGHNLVLVGTPRKVTNATQ